MELRNKVIFIVSPNNWGKMFVSKHHYAIELAKRGNKVYFINPPDLGADFFKQEKVCDNLTVISYYPIFRGKSFLPAAIFNLLIKLQISYLKRKIGFEPDVLWTFTTTIYYRPDWFKAKLTIFHPMDQVFYDDSIAIGSYSDAIFTCSDFILNEFKTLDKPKKIISHGLSPSFVNYNFENWQAKSSLNACYVGNLFIESLDRRSLIHIIESNSTHQFHFVGALKPEDSNVSSWVTEESLSFIDFLKNSKNVICYGVMPTTKIPDILSKMDVLLVCYKPSEFNVISNSHKILEYLITGRTIISSLVEYYKDSDLLEMVAVDENYLSKYNKVTSNLNFYNRSEIQNKRRIYAKNNSYSATIQHIENFLSQNYQSESL